MHRITDLISTLALAALGALCVTALALATATPAASAPDAPQFKQAKFKVSVRGWQKNVWSRDHDSTGRCDPSDHSTGSDHFRFSTKRPVRMTAIGGPGRPYFLSYGGSVKDLETRAVITRERNLAVSSIPEDCEGNGGGADPRPPDCGTITVDGWGLNLDYSQKRKDAITLTAGEGEDPFERCDNSSGFPNLLEHGDDGEVNSELPPGELFDRRIGKLIVIGTGSVDLPLIEGHTRTDVRWEVTLKRLKGTTG